MSRYIFTDGVKSIDLPQYPNEAWKFYSGEGNDDDNKVDLYTCVSAVFRAINLTANATANIPFALVKGNHDFDHSDDWQNKVKFMPNPTELIRLWRMSLTMTNTAYGFMETKPDLLRYIVPQTMEPIVDSRKGLIGFKRTIGTQTIDYPAALPIFWMWRLDHTTELLPAKATEFKAMMAAAGILYWSDYFVESFFKRGGIKPTMLVMKGMATKETVDKIETVWDKVVRGYYKYLGKIFQGVDANGGLEAQTIGEGVDSMKDDTLTQSKISDIAMSIGMPLSLLLSNSANYATASVEYKTWYENSLGPWCRFMAEALNERIFTKMGLRFEFRPEMTDPGQEDEVARAGAYSTYVSSGMKPSVAAQVVGIELPEGVEFVDLDEAVEEKEAQAQENAEALADKQPSSDTEEDAKEEQKPPAKFVPNIDQLHELELWRKFAFRKLKKGEALDFPFEVRSLPTIVADNIKVELSLAQSEDDIKSVFDVDTTFVNVDEIKRDTKSDIAIMELAEAINKAAEVEPVKQANHEMSDLSLYISAKSMKLSEDNMSAIMEAIGKLSIDQAEQKAAIDAIKQEVEVNDANTEIIVNAIARMAENMKPQPMPEIPAPIVNIAAPEVTVQPPEVTVNLPKKKPINLSVIRNNDGLITGIQEK